MVGKKIRAFREFRGYSQIQLAELSGINVGTIRKYELGIRNPKPDQLEKIATALGLNVSVFLDFNIETVGDVLSLLFSIDDSVNLSLAETSDQKISLTFDNPTMQDFFRKWCQFKKKFIILSHDFDIFLPFASAVRFCQKAGKANNSIERSTNLMTHIGQKSRLQAIQFFCFIAGNNQFLFSLFQRRDVVIDT